MVTNCLQCLFSSESLDNSALESFVFLVYFTELLLPVIFDDIVDVDEGSLKESTSGVRISMIADFYLLALNLYLLWTGIFYFCFFSSCNSLTDFLFDAEPCIFLSSHLLEELLFISFVFGFLNSVKLDLPLGRQLLGYSLGFSHFLARPDSIFFSFSLFLLFSLLPHLSRFICKLFKFCSFFLFSHYHRLALLLTLDESLLLEVGIVFVVIDPIFSHLYAHII